tara:strand:+ start:194 stop:778 length:585 start_codon:yes stop_codon:yes gene_type:complete
MKYFFLLIATVFVFTACSSDTKDEKNDHERDHDHGDHSEMMHDHGDHDHGDHSEMTHDNKHDLGGGAYGFVKINEEGAISLDELYSHIIENEVAVEAKSSGKITEVCKHSGCWVTVQLPNGEKMLVEFKDEFSIPKEGVIGKDIVFQGKGEKTTYSVEELRGYAKKEGKTAEEIKKITEPEYDVKFIAEGVLIK